jgi:adenylate cyclase
MRGDAEHALSRFDRAHPHYLASARLAGLRVPARPAGTVAGIAVELGRQLMHRCAFVPPVWDARARNRHQLAAHIHTRLAEQAYFEGDLLAILHGTLASLNGAERVRSVQEVVEGYGALAIGLGTARLHPLARFYSARSSAVARARGATREMGMACLFGAVYHFAAGCLDQAEAHAREGAEMFLRIDDRFRHQSCTTLRAQVAIARGRFEEAEALLRAFGEEAQYVENGAVRAWFLTGLVLLDLLLGRPPAPAIARLASARDERLHRGERLLCDGLEAAAWLESGDPARAQRCAEAALASMRERPPTLGIAYVSVWATARVLLDAAARAPATGRYAALAKAREACAAARSFGGKTVIARPRARLLSAELADLEGDRAGARREAARAATLARTLAMPVEEALALSMTAPAEGRALFATLGARPWLRAAAACAERAGEGEVEAFGR